MDDEKQEFKDAGEVQLEIEKLELEEPKQGTIEHNRWEEQMNILFSKYNKFVKFKAYRIFK